MLTAVFDLIMKVIDDLAIVHFIYIITSLFFITYYVLHIAMRYCLLHKREKISYYSYVPPLAKKDVRLKAKN